MLRYHRARIELILIGSLSDRLRKRFVVNDKAVRRNITEYRNGTTGNDSSHNIPRSERRHIHTILCAQLNGFKKCGNALHLAGE